MTAHARIRCQQRGTPNRLLATLLDHHDRAVPVGRGCWALSLTRNAMSELRARGLHADLVRRLARRVVVEGEDGSVVTLLAATGRAGRRYRRVLRRPRRTGRSR
jgi:hypothetical protein